MTACAKCGFDSAVEVARSYSLFFDRQPPSLNDRIQNAGNSRWKYKSERDVWCLLVRAERMRLRVPIAVGKRRVTFHRYYGGRLKLRDAANFVGGLKCVVDAFVREKLLVDDAPAYLEDHYQQHKTESGWGLVVDIEDLTP